jgi:hypothetical protein
MVYNEALKKAIYKYRAKNPDVYRAKQLVYSTKFYHDNAAKVLEYKKNKYQWDKENKYEQVAKTFRKILI